MRFSLLRSGSPRLVTKAVSFLVLALVSLLPLSGSEAGGPCLPQVSFSPQQWAPDGTVTVQATVENAGTGTCSAAYLSLHYPAGLHSVSATPEAKSGDYFWYFESLGADGKATVNLVLEMSDPSLAPLMLNATLNAANQDAEASVKIDPRARPAPTPLPARAECSPREEKGMWVWNTPRGMSEAWRKKILENMVAHGFNTAYIDGSELWELDGKPEPERSGELGAFHEGLKAFVRAARERGIGVEVTFGYRDWGEPSNRYKPLRIIDQVLSYNASVDAADRVCGVQSDIEPYLLPSYEENKAEVLGNYLETMDQLTKKVARSGSGVSMGIVIPHFYDPVQAWTPAITRAGETQSAYEHVLDILAQAPKSSVSVMAYRNFLDGENGVIELVSPELRIAQERQATARVIIAQEVGCGLDPKWVSWCGSTKTALEGALSTLRTTFRDNEWLGGFAVNYIDPYIDLAD